MPRRVINCLLSSFLVHILIIIGVGILFSHTHSEEETSSLSEVSIPEVKLRINSLPNLDWKQYKKADVVFVLGFSPLNALVDDVNMILRNYLLSFKQDKIDYRVGFARFVDSAGHRFEVSPLTEDWSVFSKRLTAPPKEKQFSDKGTSSLDLLMTTLEQIKFRKDVMKRFVLFSSVIIDFLTPVMIRNDPFVPVSLYTVEEVISACIKKDITVDVYGPDVEEVKRIASQTGGNWSRWSSQKK